MGVEACNYGVGFHAIGALTFVSVRTTWVSVYRLENTLTRMSMFLSWVSVSRLREKPDHVVALLSAKKLTAPMQASAVLTHTWTGANVVVMGVSVSTYPDHVFS